MRLCSNEDYVRILNEPYVKNPIDISVGFFGLCSYQPAAWDAVFNSVRSHYPDDPIVLISDGTYQYDYSEMAKKYNCIHVIKGKEICLHYPCIEDSYEFLHRTLEACNLTGSEWMIHLHPDVICRGKISYYPPSPLAGVHSGSCSGVANNNWKCYNVTPQLENVENYIRKFQPDVELNGWGWCGGSIMNVEVFREVYASVCEENSIFNLEDIRRSTWVGITEHEDLMMSVLFALKGHPYRVWKDNPENNYPGAFLHGYKEMYDFKKVGMSVTDHYTRCRTEQIQKADASGNIQECTRIMTDAIYRK